MTYFAFLALFLLPPLTVLLIAYWGGVRRGQLLFESFRTWSPWRVLLAHVIVAILYTTPWDNYLVATRVWWYDPALVTGLVLGWVPIEEYIFFVLQTLLSGLWLLYLIRYHKTVLLPPETQKVIRPSGSVGGVLVLLCLTWLGSLFLLGGTWSPGTYIGLELSWALPPIIFQLWFGGDILWRYRRLVGIAIALPTVYLCLGDAVAIGAGTWTINPALSVGVLVGNLPVEEILFFGLTNTLVIFGMVLVLAKESRERVPRRVIQTLDRLMHPQASWVHSVGKMG